MNKSEKSAVSELYDETAVAYSQMMDNEISLPIYPKVLRLLSDQIETLGGPLLDTSCGSGHMLEMFHQTVDPERELMGIDLSAGMVKIAKERLAQIAFISQADMCHLEQLKKQSIAGCISFFALHHLSQADIKKAFIEWHRVLQPKGCLVIGTWEGEGVIDYGETTDLVAWRYRQSEIVAWLEAAGFQIHETYVEPVTGMPMDAVYCVCTKP